MAKKIKIAFAFCVWFLTSISYLIIWLCLEMGSALLSRLSRCVSNGADRMSNQLDDRSDRFWGSYHEKAD